MKTSYPCSLICIIFINHVRHTFRRVYMRSSFASISTVGCRKCIKICSTPIVRRVISILLVSWSIVTLQEYNVDFGNSLRFKKIFRFTKEIYFSQMVSTILLTFAFHYFLFFLTLFSYCSFKSLIISFAFTVSFNFRKSSDEKGKLVN